MAGFVSQEDLAATLISNIKFSKIAMFSACKLMFCYLLLKLHPYRHSFLMTSACRTLLGIKWALEMGWQRIFRSGIGNSPTASGEDSSARSRDAAPSTQRSAAGGVLSELRPRRERATHAASRGDRSERLSLGHQEAVFEWQYGPAGHVYSVPAESSGYQGVYLSRDASSSFKHSTRESLARLESTPAGATVLNQLASINEMRPNRKVLISPEGAAVTGSQTLPGWIRPGPSFSALRETLSAHETGDAFMPYAASEGCDVGVVTYNHRYGHRFSADSSSRPIPDSDLAFVYLGHELIHASRKLHGAEMDDAERVQEELRTTGVAPWHNEYPSENAICREHGLEERPDYCGLTGDHTDAPSSVNSTYTEERLRASEANIGYPYAWRVD